MGRIQLPEGSWAGLCRWRIEGYGFQEGCRQGIRMAKEGTSIYKVDWSMGHGRLEKRRFGVTLRQ